MAKPENGKPVWWRIEGADNKEWFMGVICHTSDDDLIIIRPCGKTGKYIIKDYYDRGVIFDWHDINWKPLIHWDM